MAISIIVNGIVVPFVKTDLKTKIPNNSFTDKFAVPHSSYPVRLIEGKATKDALGDFTLLGKKKRYFPCIISEDGSLYNAELEQISKIGKFRKVNIAYKNPLTDILSKKLSDYMFPENLKGDNPIENPYTEESDAVHGAFTHWKHQAFTRRFYRFPNIQWQMATLKFTDFFTEAGEAPELAYERYFGFMNARKFDQTLHVNEYTASVDSLDVKNYNLYQPQVFVLAPIFNALSAAGYKLRGTWVTSVYAQSLLFDSYNHNMTEVIVGVTGLYVGFEGVSWDRGFLITPEIQNPFSNLTYSKKINFTTTSEGAFKIRYKFQMPPNGVWNYGLFAYFEGEFHSGFIRGATDFYEGEIFFEVFSGEVGDTLEIYYWHQGGVMPTSYVLEVVKDIDDLVFLDAHPTIDFGRYMPEWSVSGLINNLKNTYNLKIDIDEVAQVFYLNKNEDDYLLGGDGIEITKDLNISDFENVAAEAYFLKFENNEDAAPLVTKDGVVYGARVPEKAVTIENKFKVIPFKVTHELSRELEEKDGRGLMLYNPNTAPGTIDKIEGQSLTFEGEGNIVEKNWMRWLKFRLNSGRPKASGPFTKTQLDKIIKEKKIWLNHIQFLVSEIEYKETATGLFWVDMQLESITY